MAMHERWAQKIPQLSGKARNNYEEGMQCLCCSGYVPLSGELGADWGVCSNRESFFDGELVFEHHSCDAFKYA